MTAQALELTCKGNDHREARANLALEIGYMVMVTMVLLLMLLMIVMIMMHDHRNGPGSRPLDHRGIKPIQSLHKTYQSWHGTRPGHAVIVMAWHKAGHGMRPLPLTLTPSQHNSCAS